MNTCSEPRLNHATGLDECTAAYGPDQFDIDACADPELEARCAQEAANAAFDAGEWSSALREPLDVCEARVTFTSPPHGTLLSNVRCSVWATFDTCWAKLKGAVRSG